MLNSDIRDSNSKFCATIRGANPARYLSSMQTSLYKSVLKSDIHRLYLFNEQILHFDRRQANDSSNFLSVAHQILSIPLLRTVYIEYIKIDCTGSSGSISESPSLQLFTYFLLLLTSLAVMYVSLRNSASQKPSLFFSTKVFA